MTLAASCIERINSYIKLMWPDVRSALLQTSSVFCKLNLHCTDVSTSIAQDWSDVLKVLAEWRSMSSVTWND